MPDEPARPGRAVLLVEVAVVTSAGTLLAMGGRCLVAPQSFAAWTAFPPCSAHLLHDLGAFQIGLGVAVGTARIWRDALATALIGFLVADILHVLNHLLDRPLGGHDNDWWLLAVLGAVAGAGLATHLRRTVHLRRDHLRRINALRRTAQEEPQP